MIQAGEGVKITRGEKPKPCGQHVNEMPADAISDENVPRTDIASLDSNVYTLS